MAQLEVRQIAAEQRTQSGLGPQTNGDGTRTRDGTCAVMTRNISPTNPVGVQLARTMLPRGRTTRTSSRAARAGSAANITPNTDVAASNSPSPNGSEVNVMLLMANAAYVMDPGSDPLDRARRGIERLIGPPPAG
jgi:hypothetical protein